MLPRKPVGFKDLVVRFRAGTRCPVHTGDDNRPPFHFGLLNAFRRIVTDMTSVNRNELSIRERSLYGVKRPADAGEVPVVHAINRTRREKWNQ